jgi:hypothetical protein
MLRRDGIRRCREVRPKPGCRPVGGLRHLTEKAHRWSTHLAPIGRGLRLGSGRRFPIPCPIHPLSLTRDEPRHRRSGSGPFVVHCVSSTWAVRGYAALLDPNQRDRLRSDGGEKQEIRRREQVRPPVPSYLKCRERQQTQLTLIATHARHLWGGHERALAR